MENSEIYPLFESACRYLLSQQDRDPYSPTYGCMDRRHWGWKLVDYAESTFQRNVYPLAWWLAHGDHNSEMIYILREAVQAGIRYAIRIQHKDGSFDQAFPHEHSFGATAFLLHPLLETYRNAQDLFDAKMDIESSLRRAADFLCQHAETHGMISNHLAGAALSLLASADYFNEPRYEKRAVDLLDRILAHQSPEGWFMEYEGADPGYESLCLYFLAQVYDLRPTSTLRAALAKAVDFMAWFVHPDGTFGGEYGSRRTAIYYPGGLALLADEFPLAGRMTRFMLQSIALNHTITVADVDMGNLAPLLSNYVMVLAAEAISEKALPSLPFEQEDVTHDFPQAGLFIRGSKKYYAIIGASNGGVLKVYDREKRNVKWNDGGYAGQTWHGKWITTQMTDLKRPVVADKYEIRIEAPFYRMLRTVPTPFQFIILRLLNLTIMRNLWLGNQIKQLLVRMLIRDKKNIPLRLTRMIRFDTDSIIVTDQLRGKVKMRWLAYGRPFVAIHMASANYFENPETAFTASQAQHVPILELQNNDRFDVQVII